MGDVELLLIAVILLKYSHSRICSVGYVYLKVLAAITHALLSTMAIFQLYNSDKEQLNVTH